MCLLELKRSDRLRFHMLPISGTRLLNSCFLHLHNMCFHLGLPCQYVSGTVFYKSSDRANQLNPKCVCVCVCLCLFLFSSGFCDPWGETPALSGVRLARIRTREILRGLSFLSFSQTFNDSNERMERKLSGMSQKALAAQNEKQENWRAAHELLLILNNFIYAGNVD